MEEKYILEWTFTPPDYFEEPMDFQFDYGIIHVEDGKAEAHIAANLYPEDHRLRNQIHSELDAIFLGVQVLAHKPYALSKSNVTKLRVDGHKDRWVFLEGATLTLFGGRADATITDANGNIISDTRRERINLKKQFAQSAATNFGDQVANAILRSYSAAVNDARNELVHLYEIRDALTQHFGGEARAKAALGFVSGQWSRLGQLANNEPLTQGRHRGKQLGSLRDATEAELTESRYVARALIDGYFRHLRSRVT